MLELMNQILYEYYKKRKERVGRVSGNETSVDLKLQNPRISCRQWRVDNTVDSVSNLQLKIVKSPIKYYKNTHHCLKENG